MGIDLPALARIRPGMPLAALAETFGGDWVPWRRYRQTFVLADEAGFNARIDINGIAGTATFARGFPEQLKGFALA